MSNYHSDRRSGRNGRHHGNNGSRYSNRGRNNSRKGPKKAYIHPSKFVQAAKPVELKEYKPVNKFQDMPIDELIKSNLMDMGFENPSPIQDQSIPLSLDGRDIVGIANTGTGKTAAFAIPVLNELMNDSSNMALIVAPTRELAEQIDDQCSQIAKGSGISAALLIGGSPIGRQLRELRFNPRIIIGTPGRIKDHLERGSLNLSQCNLVVLDEVDRMLDMGFVNDMNDILSEVDPDHQSLYFSATMDNRVRSIIEKFSNNPETVAISSGDTTSNVEQNVVRVDRSQDRVDQLHELLIQDEVSKVLVFDETQRKVERLAKELKLRGFDSDSMHGGRSQSHRQRVLDKFKTGKVSVLVATDVAARGIDVSDISHVINYSTPQSYEDYIHRIGRTGRAGRVGYALTFVD